MIYEALSPAKINLFLQVTGKRPDGYHELFTLMCPVSLYDTISFEFETEAITICCDNPDIPSDETNLACRAAELFLNTLKKNQGVNISIKKNIPVSAGLGGGSSNAASVLSVLNKYYNYPFSQSKLMKMGLDIGADVPFFIFKKPAIATGIGEKLEFYEGLKPFQLVLIYPNFAVSTAEVYKNFNLGLTKCNKKLKYLFFENQNFDVADYLCNDLETVTASMYPEIEIAKTALLTHGAEGALMSGSGAAVFGLFSDADSANNAWLLLSKHEKWKIYQADMIV